MRFIPLILGLVLFAGCASDYPRLQGTWISNRDATVANAVERVPGWKQATPERLQRFADMFGHLSVTYSNGVEIADFRGEIETAHYRVVGRGADYVIIQSDAATDKGRDIKIRFVDGDTAYWIHSPFAPSGMDERFDKVQSR